MCACVCGCPHTIASLRVILGVQEYGEHRCCVYGCPQVRVCSFVSYWGKLGLVLTNPNWSGWMLTTDITTV